jgi:hypothetical protein
MASAFSNPSKSRYMMLRCVMVAALPVDGGRSLVDGRW